MSKKELPDFLIYQPNQKEFHICLEAQGKFLRWCSYYPPTLDVRYPREVTRIEDMALNKRPRKQIFDEGFYTITKSDTKESIEGKVTKGIEMKSFSFILNGKKLRGRFAIKKNSNSTVLQKFKDKFATEEDVLSSDLARTISTMIPNYDEKKVKLNRPLKVKQVKARQPEVKPVEVPEINEIQPVEVPEVEEVTADKKIGSADYHFAYYTSKNEPAICLISSVNAEVVILKKEQDKWVMQTPPGRTMLKNEKEFAEHAKALYDSLDS